MSGNAPFPSGIGQMTWDHVSLLQNLPQEGCLSLVGVVLMPKRTKKVCTSPRNGDSVAVPGSPNQLAYQLFRRATVTGNPVISDGTDTIASPVYTFSVVTATAERVEVMKSVNCSALQTVKTQACCRLAN
ncbi:unnamed protein product [Protopolystoma xenopodis]|uniref:Uncharacterized protein n=1 Tax=Protopolystoma xenopodis TaxID=117903 RepID=A0A3S5CTG6_9PLAT|nr:unnamed protein product [Protopolystoma xenopodis]